MFRRLKEYCFKQTDLLVSFDVVSLFTNVALEFTINIIVDHIYIQDSIPTYDVFVCLGQVFLTHR